MFDLNNYETIFIINNDLNEEGKKGQIKKVKGLIEQDGTIDSVDEWGKKRLAYEINKQKTGYFVFVEYKANPSIIANLNGYFKISEQIIRHMTIKKDIEKKKDKPKIDEALTSAVAA